MIWIETDDAPQHLPDRRAVCLVRVLRCDLDTLDRVEAALGSGGHSEHAGERGGILTSQAGRGVESCGE